MAKNRRPPSEVSISGDPFHIALVCMFSELSPEWKTLDLKTFDALDHRALESLVAAGIVELQVGTQTRCGGFPYLLQAIFRITGYETDAGINDQLIQLATGAPDWIDDSGVPRSALMIRKFIMGAKLSDRGVSLHRLGVNAAEVFRIMQQLVAGKIPPRAPEVVLEDWRPWNPSELQSEIWKALDGQARTTDELEHILSVSRPTLFKKPGGLPEMVDLGLIKNDRAHGGYYRAESN
jgi:hypothetical protein